MKALTYLTTGLCAIMLTFSSSVIAGPKVAVDWGSFGFTPSAGPVPVYFQSHGPLSYVVTNGGSFTSVAPSSGVGDVILPGAPIANAADVPIMKNVQFGAGSYQVIVTSTAPILAPGEYFILGGAMTGDTLNFGIGGASNASMSLVGFGLFTNAIANAGGFVPGGSTFASWSPVTGTITNLGAPGHIGAMFFQNIGGAPVTQATFINSSGMGNPTYIAVTTPEPSTYLAMAGGLGVLALLALRRKAKAKV